MALWQRMLDVNLTGTFLCTQAVLPGMLARRTTAASSTSPARRARRRYAYVAAYCAAKHGVIGLTRALALEVARKSVTVNAVCPGYTETDMRRRAPSTNIVAKTGRSAEEARAELAAAQSAGPPRCSPQEVANTVLWLCLPGGEAITGQAISVSGGEVM